MASDPQRQADISDAHHEGFGAGMAWADQTPDTGDELDAIKERASDPRRYRTPIGAQLADCRQSLTEAEASYQAEIGRLRAELAMAYEARNETMAALKAMRQDRDDLDAFLTECRVARDGFRAELDTAMARGYAQAMASVQARRGASEENDRMAQIGRLQEQLLSALIERDAARHGRRETDQWADSLREQREAAEAARDTLTARLAEAEKVVEAAAKWWQHRPSDPSWLVGSQPGTRALGAAVDAYRASRAETAEVWVPDDPHDEFGTGQFRAEPVDD